MNCSKAFVRVGLSAFSPKHGMCQIFQEKKECICLICDQGFWKRTLPSFQIPFHPYQNESQTFLCYQYCRIIDLHNPCKCKGSEKAKNSPTFKLANNQYWRHRTLTRSTCDTRKASAGCRSYTLGKLCGSRSKGNATPKISQT